MKSIIPCLGGDDFFVHVLPCIIDFFDDNPFIQNRSPFPDVEEGVGLFIIYNIVKLVGVSDLGIMVIFLPDSDD